MRLHPLISAAALSLAIVACGEEPTTTADPQATIEISDLYVLAPSAGRDVAGGGMKITATNGDFRLVSASSEAADRVELHTMSMEDDMMKMRQVDGFDIVAGETFVLEPGGAHLMLFGLDDDLMAGDEAEMVFTFEDANGVNVTLNYPAEVKARDAN